MYSELDYIYTQLTISFCTFNEQLFVTKIILFVFKKNVKIKKNKRMMVYRGQEMFVEVINLSCCVWLAGYTVI